MCGIAGYKLNRPIAGATNITFNDFINEKVSNSQKSSNRQ